MNLKQYVGQVLVYVLVVSGFLGATWCGSLAISVISQAVPVARTHTIVIDAGHGGEDGGAVSCTGARESEINLKVALKLNDLLHLLGYRTKMVRTTDISVYTAGDTLAQKKVSDLKERVRLVQVTENPILVSIHQNIYSDARYTGAQVFYNGTNEGKALAEALQLQFVSTLNSGSRRQSKRSDGVYLMDRTQSPAVLVECGFLSNPGEEALLRDHGYQQKVAAVIGCALGNFLDGQTND